MSMPPAARSCTRGRRAVRRHPGDVIGLQAHRRQPADEREMPDAALTGAGCLELAVRRRLDRVGQLLDVLVRARRVDLHARRVLVHQRQRRVAGRIELGEALMVHHRDLDRDHADGVAVGRRGRDRRMADDARAAGAVDDVERLPEILLENGRDDARGRVGAAAGAPRTDHRHGTRRPGACALAASRPMIEAAPAAALAASSSRRVSLVMAVLLGLFCHGASPVRVLGRQASDSGRPDKKAYAPDEIRGPATRGARRNSPQFRRAQNCVRRRHDPGNER